MRSTAVVVIRTRVFTHGIFRVYSASPNRGGLSRWLNRAVPRETMCVTRLSIDVHKRIDVAARIAAVSPHTRACRGPIVARRCAAMVSDLESCQRWCAGCAAYCSRKRRAGRPETPAGGACAVQPAALPLRGRGPSGFLQVDPWSESDQRWVRFPCRTATSGCAAALLDDDRRSPTQGAASLRPLVSVRDADGSATARMATPDRWRCR